MGSAELGEFSVRVLDVVAVAAGSGSGWLRECGQIAADVGAGGFLTHGLVETGNEAHKALKFRGFPAAAATVVFSRTPS